MKMQNKKAKQIAAKKAHLEQLRARRRAEPILERLEGKRKTLPTILIVCEGQNTEPSYFRQFRLSTATIKAFGEGLNTVTLVERTIEVSKSHDYEQVWCVFDADPKPDNPNQANNFNTAIKIAEKAGIRVAYSNQAFEYWIILHFNDHQGGSIDRKDYDALINKEISQYGLRYDGKGSKVIDEGLFGYLESIDEKTKKSRVKLAIDRATRNYNLFDHSNPAAEESSTTVYQLVEELLKFK